jgi:hypothetical protein
MQQAREQNENTVGANRIVLERITQEQNDALNALRQFVWTKERTPQLPTGTSIRRQCEPGSLSSELNVWSK